MFVEPTADHAVPQPVRDAGYQYLLERDDIAELLVFLKRKRVSRRTAAEFVIHYAVMDCTPSWIDDIPDA